MTPKIVVGMTGASGTIYGIRLLEVLREQPVETHLVVSDWAVKTIRAETKRTIDSVLELADRTYRNDNLAARISSGSFLTDGMVIAPCSVNTLAAIAHGITQTLIPRAADVTLKEGRKLFLLVRESPLTAIHLENMLRLAKIGAVIAPPVPAFYIRPTTLEEVIDHTVARVLDHFGIQNDLSKRWGTSAQYEHLRNLTVAPNEVLQ